MKTTRHSLLAKGLMVLLSLLILIFAFTYSWFSTKQEADATGISASVESDGDFEYAIGFYNSGTNNNYAVTAFTSDSTALDLKHLNATVNGTDYTYYDLLHDYQPIDLTGDGPTLIRPSMEHGNTNIKTASDDYSIATPNKQYINFDLYFRSATSGVPIYLMKGSYAQAACETVLGNISSRSSVNTSTYGTFSRDAIVGAVRIAFIPYTYTTAPATLTGDDGYQALTGNQDKTNSWVWLPRPDIHTNYNDTTSGWTMSYGMYPNTYSTKTYIKNNVEEYPADDVHKYYNIFNGTKALVEPTNTILPSQLNSGANQLMSRIGTTFHYGNYYYTKVNVRIWIEGTDAQSRRAFSGGQFSVNFKFGNQSTSN